jgi:GST-like protein
MIDLHTVPTANGYKASIMLEELALDYRTHSYDLRKGDNFDPQFLAINPVARLPTIVDHATDDGAPLAVYGSAAILIYLAEKSGRLLPTSGRARTKTFEWFSGQFAFNVVAPEKLPWAISYYDKLCLRMAGVLEQQLAKTTYLVGEDYSIADIIAFPVAAVSMKRFPGSLDGHPNLARWAALLGARPAVQRGMQVPA